MESNSINLDTINKYIEGIQTEINLSKNYEENTRIVLSNLSRFHEGKPFLDIGRNDIIAYLNSLRKPEEADPLHKWIGTLYQNQ